MTTYVQSTLTYYILATYTFGLWMSKEARDVFVVVLNFISSDWEAKLVTIGLFEVSNMSSVAMAPKLQELLDRFSLTHNFFAFVKDERSNLHTCASTLTSIVSCNNLGLLEPFDGTCFKHALSKVCQYAIANEKVSTGLPLASIKAAQSSLHKCNA
jgi:hypothetical protein